VSSSNSMPSRPPSHPTSRILQQLSTFIFLANIVDLLSPSREKTLPFQFYRFVSGPANNITYAYEYNKSDTDAEARNRKTEKRWTPQIKLYNTCWLHDWCWL
jgi:hypothetical protein